MAFCVLLSHNIYTMAKKTAPLLPSSAERLRQLGERLRLARMRRRLTAKQVAQRAGMAPMTLRSIERGGSGVTIGAYMSVMQALGIDEDLDLIASTDPSGRQLQDARLPSRARATKAPEPLDVERVAPQPDGDRNNDLLDHGEDIGDWAKDSGFESSTALAGLIEVAAPRTKKRS